MQVDLCSGRKTVVVGVVVVILIANSSSVDCP